MNHQLPFRLTLLAILCLFTAAGMTVHAAQDDRWFRVELLIFSHEAGPADESWDPTPELAYPDTVRFLMEPELMAANQAQYEVAGTVDEFGRQIFILPGDDTGLDSPPPDPALPPDDDSPPAEESPAANETPSIEMPLLPTAFRALPASQREFRGKAAYMQRTGRYSTLFHQAWLQPVPDRDRALPLVLDRSGDTGEWPPLQGSVLLYLSRYLHLETNLWLNTRGDYLPGEWRMPAPPLGPPSLIVEEPPAEPLDEALLDPRITPGGDPGQMGATESGQEEVTDVEQDPVFPYRHAVLVTQKRRMRSNEVHYLDHPLLGLVVKLTPLSEEDLALLAQAEESGDYPPLQP